MLHIPTQNCAGTDTGSWSANHNSDKKRVLIQLTDNAGSQSRAVLDTVDAALFVQHLISACQSVNDPDTYPRRYPGTRWCIERKDQDVAVMVYDDILPPETTTVEMTVHNATDLAKRAMEAIIVVQASNNQAGNRQTA